MKKKMLLCATAALSITLGGCAALDHRAGTEVTQAQLDSFKAGKSRQADVLARLGQPGQKSEHKGREVWTYSFTKIAAMPWAKNVSESTVFEFDKRGVVLNAYKAGGTPGKSGNPLLDAAGM